jgi:hypothetical protein
MIQAQRLIMLDQSAAQSITVKAEHRVDVTDPQHDMIEAGEHEGISHYLSPI